MIILFIISINIVTYGALILLVLRKWKKKGMYRYLLLLLITALVWIIATNLSEEKLIQQESSSLTLLVDYGTAPLVAYFFAIFSLSFKRKGKSLNIKYLLLLLVLPLGASILGYSGLVANFSEGTEPMGAYVLRNTVLFFPYYSLLIIYFLLVAGGVIINKYLHSVGIEKQRTGYLLLGYLLSILPPLILSFTTNIFDALHGRIYQIIVSSSIIFPVFTTYAVMRYRLFDLKIVVKKGMAYFITVIPLLATYTYLILYFENILIKKYYWDEQAALLLAVLIISITFLPLYRLVKFYVDKLFFEKKELTKNALRALGRQVPKISLRSLAKDIKSIVQGTLSKVTYAIYYFDHSSKSFKKQQISDFGPSNISIRSIAVQYFSQQRKPIIKEEIGYKLDDVSVVEAAQLLEIEKELNSYKAAAIVPLGNNRDISGLILIGKKNKDDAFTVEDLVFLKEFQMEASLALDNMIMYERALVNAGIKNSYA